MIKIPLKNPTPDFNNLSDVLAGKKEPLKVIFVEALIDEEIKKYIIENYFHEENIPPPPGKTFGDRNVKNDQDDNLHCDDNYSKYYIQLINFYFRMGYDIFPDDFYYMVIETFNTKIKTGIDTAGLSRGHRYWAEEGFGSIRTWDDFEKFPWDKAEAALSDYGNHLEFLSSNLPDGMKIATISAIFEPILEWMLGYEGLFLSIYDNPDLVNVLFNKVGNLVYKAYSIAVSFKNVGVIWHGDDIGFKTSTFISPEYLRKWLIPWLKKFSILAHQNNKFFWYHVCGYKTPIMEDLIYDVNVDAIHAFEDACCPVIAYKKKYGGKIGLLGGVDMDKLVRFEEDKLREYIREILGNCMVGGRYALGSGNSISNYVPVKNFLIMLDEGSKWSY